MTLPGLYREIEDALFNEGRIAGLRLRLTKGDDDFAVVATATQRFQFVGGAGKLAAP